MANVPLGMRHPAEIDPDVELRLQLGHDGRMVIAVVFTIWKDEVVVLDCDKFKTAVKAKIWFDKVALTRPWIGRQ